MMKRSMLHAAALLLIVSSYASAGVPLEDKDREDSLLGFLTGSYEMIGKHPDGSGTYQGTMTLMRKSNELVVTRNIKGRKTIGTAKIIAATADNIPILQADFIEGKQKYRVIYMIGSDLDNYARLTGKVYFAVGETRAPGLEALFIQQASD